MLCKGVRAKKPAAESLASTRSHNTHAARAFMFFRAEYDIFGDTEQVVLPMRKGNGLANYSRTPVKVRKMPSLKLSSAAARP